MLESPFAGDTDTNISYALRAMRDCFERGEAPFASHLLYPQALSDDIPAERKIGISAGLAWGRLAEATVVYTDLGISKGMQEGITRAVEAGRQIEFRSINKKPAGP